MAVILFTKDAAVQREKIISKNELIVTGQMIIFCGKVNKKQYYELRISSQAKYRKKNQD